MPETVTNRSSKLSVGDLVINTMSFCLSPNRLDAVTSDVPARSEALGSGDNAGVVVLR